MRKIIALFVILFALAVSPSAFAADFKILPLSGTFGVGKIFSIDLKIDTFGESVNAAQGKLQFNPAVLEIKSISKTGSVFNFWLQEPTFANDAGTIEFIGGTPSGVSGSSLQVLSVTFSAKTLGTSDFAFINASITASDGTGTNIFGNATGAGFNVSSGGGGVLPGAAGTTAPEAVPSPVQIIRAPVAAKGLPSKPDIKVQLYPNPENWYSLVSNFVASWNLPPDIAELNTALNQNPNFDAPKKPEGLFDSKTFSALDEDGIYYLHARFKNNIGWGPTAHYRIAIDTQPPLAFNIEIPTGAKSDNPSPKITFNTGDALSGLGSFKIILEGEEPVMQTDVTVSEYAFKPHPPGAYTVRVIASDKAGNGVESRAQIEILPIETPEIISITEKVIIGTGDILVIKGTAIANANVIVSIEDSDKFLVLQNEVSTNERGEWEFRLDRELRRGGYLVSVKAKDSRDAVSLPTEPIKVKFADKPVISIFGLDITLRGLVLLLVLVVVAGALYFWRKALLHFSRSQREAVIISRDLKNAFDLIKKDLNRMIDMLKRDSVSEEKKFEIDATNKKIGETLDKIEKYLSKDIEKME